MTTPDTSKVSVKEIGAYFGMTPKDMIREWKTCPDSPTDEERRTLLTKDEKDAIRDGISDGSFTYA
jgi:uncharacterized protein YdaU (DUF1376 family)